MTMTHAVNPSAPLTFGRSRADKKHTNKCRMNSHSTKPKGHHKQVVNDGMAIIKLHYQYHNDNDNVIKQLLNKVDF